jgi:hypothetical protein
MRLGSCRPHRRGTTAVVWLVAFAAAFSVLTPSLAATGAAGSHPVTRTVRRADSGNRAGHTYPNFVRGSAYLVSPANLIDGHFYESFPGYADFGLTIDGAFALAATGDDRAALKKIVAFLDGDGKDPSGNTVNNWTGIGTASASGGAIGKEALLVEVVGGNPRHFGGRNLIAALNASVCARATQGAGSRCPAAGSYAYGTSVFDQALGIMAQLREGQGRPAAAPIAFLERLQNADGSFPSLVPDSGDQDVDSTAMAVMALALAPGARAAADVTAGVAWIAGRQEKNGGFPSATGESINSAGLAVQAMTLKAADYQRQIAADLAFLAREQNSDGGFRAYATGPQGSNLRASTQAVGGAVGTSFGTLHRALGVIKPGSAGSPTPSPAPSPVTKATVSEAPSPAVTVTVTVTVTPAPLQPPPITPAPRASVRSSLSAGSALVTTGNDSKLTTSLWLAALAIAVVAAAVIGLLLVRRRRMYPPGGRSADGAGS